jgi:hypothetical protein
LSPCLFDPGLGAYVLGVRQTEQANWHTVTVDLAAVGADPSGPDRELSIMVDGWTYGLSNSVTWIDTQGAVHDSGWPACLEPAHPGFSRRSHKLVRRWFAETADVSFRPFVIVDCRPAAA